MKRDEIINHPLYEKAKYIKHYIYKDRGIAIEYIIWFMQEWDEAVNRIKHYGE